MWWCALVYLATAVAQNPFTLEEFVTGQFSQRGFTGTWISGKIYASSENKV